MSEETGNNVPATGTKTATAPTDTPAPAPAVDKTPKGDEPKQETALATDVKKDGEATGTVDDLASFEFDAEFGMTDEDKANSLAVFKTFGVQTKEQAGKVVDFLKAMDTERARLEDDATNQMLERWDKSLEADEEFGKDYNANIDIAQKALDRYGGESLTNWLEKTGFNRNPDIVKMFWRIGKDLQEAKVLAGNNGSQPKLNHDKFGNPIFNLSKSFGNTNK